MEMETERDRHRQSQMDKEVFLPKIYNEINFKMFQNFFSFPPKQEIEEIDDRKPEMTSFNSTLPFKVSNQGMLKGKVSLYC